MCAIVMLLIYKVKNIIFRGVQCLNWFFVKLCNAEVFEFLKSVLNTGIIFSLFG